MVGEILSFVGGIGGIVIGILFLAIVMVLVQSYTKAPADRAFYKTGASRKVVMNGADFVIPLLHQMIWVDLRTMDIDIERTEDNALLTIDPQYADIRAIFYIKVNPVTEDIERAARTIGGKEVNAQSVKQLVESKLEGALRDVAATFTLMSLHQEREKFVERVQNLVREDLAQNGLVLESVSITALKSARQGSFGVDDVFGAQVARANAKVIQEALKNRNEIDQTTQTEVSGRNAEEEQRRNSIELRKQIQIEQDSNAAQLAMARDRTQTEREQLDLDQGLSQARAAQQREIAISEAREESTASQDAYQQQQAAELARVSKERSIAEAEEEKRQAIQLAEQRRQQAIELAVQEREREVEGSKVLKQQTVEIADQERKVALAQEQARLEAAERTRLEEVARREAAEQEVFTVQEQAAAEREAKISTINAERDARKSEINRKNEIDIAAYQKVEDAKAEAEALNARAIAEATASIKMAEARRTEAQAAADAERMRAEAAQATTAAAGLAEAEVISAKAHASRDEAEAIKAKGLAEAEAIRAKSLAEAEGQRAMADALAANEGVAQRLEIERLRVQAQIEVGVSQARALGEALAAMDFRLYGSPETAQQILRMVSLGDGIGNVFEAIPAPLKDLGERLADRVLPPKDQPGGNGQDGSPAAAGYGDIQHLLIQGGALLNRLISAEDQRSISVQAAIAQALEQVSPDSTEHAILLRLQQLAASVPFIGQQTIGAILQQYASDQR